MSYDSKFTSFCAFFMLLFMLVSPIQYCFFNQKAYAHGLSQENLPPISIGNRQMSLYLKINPLILTPASAHNAYMQFRLFNVINNEPAHNQHVTYKIIVTNSAVINRKTTPLRLISLTQRAINLTYRTQSKISFYEITNYYVTRNTPNMVKFPAIVLV
jgi:hypothetical protein